VCDSKSINNTFDRILFTCIFVHVYVLLFIGSVHWDIIDLISFNDEEINGVLEDLKLSVF